MSGCHQVDVEVGAGGGVALVGNPNVGKSVLFQRLTGRYATVSNCAGTTVQVTRGAAHFLPDTPVIDTPGSRVQRSPVAVVMIEHTQLAFESRLARGILVEPLTGG